MLTCVDAITEHFQRRADCLQQRNTRPMHTTTEVSLFPIRASDLGSRPPQGGWQAAHTLVTQRQHSRAEQGPTVYMRGSFMLPCNVLHACCMAWQPNRTTCTTWPRLLKSNDSARWSRLRHEGDNVLARWCCCSLAGLMRPGSLAPAATASQQRLASCWGGPGANHRVSIPCQQPVLQTMSRAQAELASQALNTGPVQELFSPGAQSALLRIWAPRRGLFTLCFDPAKRADGLKLVEEREDGKLIMVISPVDMRQGCTQAAREGRPDLVHIDMPVWGHQPGHGSELGMQSQSESGWPHLWL